MSRARKQSGGLSSRRLDAMSQGLRRAHRCTRPRPPNRQTAEIQLRAALMNRFNARGTAEIIRVG